MNSKKSIKQKQELKKKKQKRKETRNLILGGLFFAFAIFQAIMIISNLLSEPEHNKIVLGDRVVTTEVCTQWFNSSMQFDFSKKSQIS